MWYSIWSKEYIIFLEDKAISQHFDHVYLYFCPFVLEFILRYMQNT